MNDCLLRAVTAHGLPTAPSGSVLTATRHEIVDLLDQAKRHRVTGLVAGAVADGALVIDDESFDRVADQHESWCAHVLSVERLTVNVADAFDEAGVTFRLFKGSALAHGVYADPGRRLFADVDLVVPSDQFERATAVVESRFDGYRALPELRAGFDREFGKENLVRVGRLEVDIHRTIAPGPVGLAIPLAELFEGASGSIEVGGRTLPTLPPMAEFMQVCINAAIGDYPPRLLSLRDVAEVVARLDPDPAELEATARRWRSLAAVRRAVLLAWNELNLTPSRLPRWASTVRPPRLDQLLLRSYLTPARSYTRPAASLLVIPGIRPRARFVRAIVRPQPAYFEARGWSQASHARRAVDRLRRR